MQAFSKLVLLTGLASLVLFFGTSQARVIERWPYDKLFKQADLVLLVKPLTVRDAKEADAAVPPADAADILVGVVTSFEVLHVGKGEYKQEKFDLVHFRMKEGANVVNGPSLVSFHTKPTKLSGKHWAGEFKSEYMLFLKKGKDGRFEPASGQFDPKLSVKQVLRPLP